MLPSSAFFPSIVKGSFELTEYAKHFGLIEGRSYVHVDNSQWGQGVVFIDKTGNLNIDFSRAGIKSILSERSAARLRLLPTGFKYFNKPALLSDGQIVVVMSGEISLDGDEVYKVFRETEPRIMQVKVHNLTFNLNRSRFTARLG